MINLINNLLFNLYDFDSDEEFDTYCINHIRYKIITENVLFIKDKKLNIMYFVECCEKYIQMHIGFDVECGITQNDIHFTEIMKGVIENGHE